MILPQLSTVYMKVTCSFLEYIDNVGRLCDYDYAPADKNDIDLNRWCSYSWAPPYRQDPKRLSNLGLAPSDKHAGTDK